MYFGLSPVRQVVRHHSRSRWRSPLVKHVNTEGFRDGPAFSSQCVLVGLSPGTGINSVCHEVKVRVKQSNYLSLVFCRREV